MIKMNVETNSVTLYVCRNANSEISFLCNKPPVWAVQISIYPFQSDFTITTDTTRIILHPCVINAIMIKSESTKFEKIDIDRYLSEILSAIVPVCTSLPAYNRGCRGCRTGLFD